MAFGPRIRLFYLLTAALLVSTLLLTYSAAAVYPSLPCDNITNETYSSLEQIRDLADANESGADFFVPLAAYSCGGSSWAWFDGSYLVIGGVPTVSDTRYDCNSDGNETYLAYKRINGVYWLSCYSTLPDNANESYSCTAGTQIEKATGCSALPTTTTEEPTTEEPVDTSTTTTERPTTTAPSTTTSTKAPVTTTTTTSAAPDAGSKKKGLPSWAIAVIVVVVVVVVAVVVVILVLYFACGYFRRTRDTSVGDEELETDSNSDSSSSSGKSSYARSFTTPRVTSLSDYTNCQLTHGCTNAAHLLQRKRSVASLMEQGMDEEQGLRLHMLRHKATADPIFGQFLDDD